MKRGNIFNINPHSQNALQIIVSQIIRILSDPKIDCQKIEIELKYAQFKYFSPQKYLGYLNQLSQVQRNKQIPMRDYVQLQRYYFKDTLKKLSHQNLITLNDLGRNVYKLAAGFNQYKYQKYYQMAEFLIKQCQFNQNLKNKKILLYQQPKNIYHQYSLIGDNSSFKMIDKEELRFDVIFKDTTSSLQGRYSYSKNYGWVKTKKKQLLREQIDLMLTQKTFRLAINHQEQQGVPYQDLVSLREEIIKRKFKMIDIRLKKTLKCTKSDIIQFSLSQVYQPRKNQGSIPEFQDLIEFITQDNLDQYLLQKFQNFYKFRRPQQLNDPTISQIRWQMQSQFTKQGVKNLKNLIEKKQYRMINYEIDQAIQSLYNLFFADHSVRTCQAVWMDQIMRRKQQYENNFREQRLTNEFGQYMHNILYDQMTIYKNPTKNNTN